MRQYYSQEKMKLVKNDLHKDIKFWLVLFLVFLSGNPGINGRISSETIYVVFAVFLAYLLLRNPRSFIKTPFILVSIGFFAILLFQCFDFSFFPIITIIGFFIRLFIGYAVIMLVPDFPYVFVRVMFTLSLLSFPFYIFQQVSQMVGYNFITLLMPLINLISPQSGAKKCLIFHTFMIAPTAQFRNPGVFWEPGVFAGYLILALIFLAIIKHEIAKQNYKRYLIILSIALFTTLSTAGYVIYPLVLLLHYHWLAMSMNKTIGKWLLGAFVVLPLIVTVSIYSYQNFDFLQTKIDNQLETVEYREGRWYRGRIGSIVFDWEYIKERPLTGWGLHTKTRFALHPWMESSEGMGNGFSDFTANFGISGMLLFLITLYRGMLNCTRGNRIKSLYILLIVVLILQGESFLGLPLFLGLMFLSGTLKEKRKVPLNPLRIQSV